MLPSGTKFFAGDLPDDEQKLVWATLFPPNSALFNEQMLTADQIAWRTKPSWYVLATQDHTVHPDLQRWVSSRMRAKVIEVASSHVPMLSQPDVVIKVIRQAVAEVSKADER
jgi:pimeloyl-ACP methyl ester carboxylesterase